MIKKHLKLLIITSIIILLPIVAGLVLWNQLPEQVPSHWNAEGEIDGWSSKPFVVFALPAIMLALQWLCVLVISNDPKRQNHPQKILQLTFWLIPVLTVALSALTYATAMGESIRVEMIMPVILGVVFVVVGNERERGYLGYLFSYKCVKSLWCIESRADSGSAKCKRAYLGTSKLQHFSVLFKRGAPA